MTLNEYKKNLYSSLINWLFWKGFPRSQRHELVYTYHAAISQAFKVLFVFWIIIKKNYSTVGYFKMSILPLVSSTLL